MPNSLTYLDAALLILTESQQPLSAREVFDEVQTRDLVDNIRHIPFNSVEKLLERYIVRSGDASLIEIIDSTRYKMRDKVTELSRSTHSRKVSTHAATSQQEEVWVFESKILEKLGKMHGVDRDYQKYMDLIFNEGTLEFKNKSSMEIDSTYMQVVSYIMVRYQDKLLRFTRNDANINAEHDHLDGKYSIGFGGHIQHIDHDMFSNYAVYENSVRRELREELSFRLLPSSGSLETIGVLYDDLTPLGRQHLAFIHLLDLNKPSFRSGEDVIQELKLVDFQEISNEFGSYEYWSKLCLETYFPEKLSKTTYICPNSEFSLRNNDRYLSVVGTIGSGKSLASMILEEEFGYKRVPVSSILRELLESASIEEIGRTKMQDIGLAFITTSGSHAKLAKTLVDFMNLHPSEKYVLDGLRYTETQVAVEDLLEEAITTIYVQNPIDCRFNFYNARHGNITKLSDFIQISSHPVERQIPLFFPKAEIVIYNHGSDTSFTSALRNFFKGELTDDFLIESKNINASKRHEQLIAKIDLTFWEVILPQIVGTLRSCPNYETYSILDAGCGTGVLSSILAQHVNSLVGIDSSPESIRYAKDYCKNTTNIDFQCVATEEYDAETKFDFIVANMNLQAEKSLDQSLKRIYAHLKPGGTFVCTIPHPIFYPIRKRYLFPRKAYNYNKHAFYKIAFSIRNDTQPLPSLIPYFHRTLEHYFITLRHAGFDVEEQLEPVPNEKNLSHFLKDEWTYPHILMFVCRKLPYELH